MVGSIRVPWYKIDRGHQYPEEDGELQDEGN